MGEAEERGSAIAITADPSRAITAAGQARLLTKRQAGPVYSSQRVSRAFADDSVERATFSNILLTLDGGTTHVNITTYPSDTSIAAGNRFSLAVNVAPRSSEVRDLRLHTAERASRGLPETVHAHAGAGAGGDVHRAGGSPRDGIADDCRLARLSGLRRHGPLHTGLCAAHLDDEPESPGH